MKRFCLFAIALVSFPAAIFAGEQTVTLKQAINLALLNNNLVKAAEYESIAAKRGVSSSRSRYFPRIYLDENFTASNSPTRVFMMKLDQGRFTQNDFLIENLNHPSSENDFRTAFTLEQPLFDMNIIHGTQLASADSEEKSFALDKRKEDIGFMVLSAFLQVHKAGKALDAAEKAVNDAREHVRLAKVRNDAGTGLKSDELRSLSYLAEMEQQEITARNDLVLARMRLSLATGGKAGEELDISETPPAMAPGPDAEEMLSLALKNRKDLQMMEKEKEKASIGVKMATSSYLPTLNGSASYQMNDRNTPFGRDNDAWIVGASLRWEIFDGMRRLSERSKAEALRNSAREYLEQQYREIDFQVRESLLRREEAAKRLEVAKASLLNAEEGLRLIEKRFANSLATMVEVLDAQTALNRSRTDLVETENSYALATAAVWHTAGIFLKEVMK